jgi:hypothetical protein
MMGMGQRENNITLSESESESGMSVKNVQGRQNDITLGLG